MCLEGCKLVSLQVTEALSALIVFGNMFFKTLLLLFMVVKQEKMAPPAHGHIIEDPEEDYHGKEIKKKRGLEEKDSFGKRMKQQPEKLGRRKRGRKRQKMFGKCSTTCLQFIINFLEPSQSHGCGAHANRAIPFHWQMWLCCVLSCLFTHFLCANRTWGSLRKHMLPEGQQVHTLSAGEMQQWLDAVKHLWMDDKQFAAPLGQENQVVYCWNIISMFLYFIFASNIQIHSNINNLFLI